MLDINSSLIFDVGMLNLPVARQEERRADNYANSAANRNRHLEPACAGGQHILWTCRPSTSIHFEVFFEHFHIDRTATIAVAAISKMMYVFVSDVMTTITGTVVDFAVDVARLASM